MSFLGSLAGAVTLGFYEEGGDAPASVPTPPSPPPIDYSAVMAYQSDNNKTTALAQITAQEFALQQSSVDRQMQLAANLELGLERLDTNLQIGKLQFIEHMTAEQNRHQEKLASANTQWQSLSQGGGTVYEDVPPPDHKDS